MAQRKHDMFGNGKRILRGEGRHPYLISTSDHLPSSSSASSMDSLNLEMEYRCDFADSTSATHQNVDGHLPAEPVVFIVDNYLTHSPPEDCLVMTRPSVGELASKEISQGRSGKDRLSRDEKQVLVMNLPISTDEIINLPLEEFNKRLSNFKFILSEAQLTFIRGIRRRGKNKVAARNRRQRKRDQVRQLAEEVQRIRGLKQNLLREREELIGLKETLKDKYSLLYHHVFQSLRDPDGQPYSLNDYRLQQAADGNIVVVPRNTTVPANASIMDEVL